MTKVLVHAGFHKTGTTSLQNVLGRNRKVLSPHFSYYGKTDFLQAGAKARMYGQRRFVWRRIAFRRSFRRFLLTVPADRVIVLSRETFSGAMPGHRDIFGRTLTDQTETSCQLAQEIVAALYRRFGRDTEIEFLYTTREHSDWISSVHGHLLRSIRITENHAEFQHKLAKTPAPATVAQAVAKRIAPVPVHIARLEDYADQPEGPAAAIFDLLNVPNATRDLIRTTGPKNVGPSASTRAALLELNKGNHGKDQLKELKESMSKRDFRDEQK